MTAPGEMSAAFIERLGPPEQIAYGPRPRPRPGPTDVLVRVQATAVNPVDTFVRSGAYRTAIPFPFVVGRDLVGVVSEPGSAAVGFEPGEPVWCNSLGHGGRQGAAAEYAVVAAERLYRLPPGADPVAAVAVLHPVATAHLALFTHADLRPGEIVCVGGGAGHVGGALVRLASRADARVIATARGEDLAYCRSLGASVVLDYRSADLVEQIRAAAPEGVDVYVDTSGHQDLVNATNLLARRGRILLLAGLQARSELPAGDLYRRDGRIVGFVISNASVSELSGAAARINQLLEVEAAAPRRVEALPLSAAAEAHRRLESGQARATRLVLIPARG